MCLCNATCPFFSSVSRSARLRLLYVHARTHLSRVRHERPSLSLSFFSFCLRFSGRALVARVCALAVTLCSFVSVSTSAESEVSDTDARSRIASFVYASRSMTVRWRIGEPWSWSSRIYSRNVRAPVNAGHVIPERDVTELPRVCQWRVARRQWWWTDAWKLFYVHVERWCKYGWHESWKTSMRKTFSSFEEYRVSGSFDVTRALFANRCTLIDGYSTFERSRRKWMPTVIFELVSRTSNGAYSV